MLKHLKDIDQSLRTVATQLLNISNDETVSQDNQNQTTQKMAHVMKSGKIEIPDSSTLRATSPIPSSKEEARTESTYTDTTTLIYGRPINSKFSYFGSGHPGEAMALTEEEIEREINLTKVTTTQKNEPTTTGGISTWILLNPPSTSMKNIYENISSINEIKDTKIETTIKPTSAVDNVNITSNINTVLNFVPDTKLSDVEVKNKNETAPTNSPLKKLLVSSTKVTKPVTNEKKSTKPNAVIQSTSTTTRNTESKILLTTVKPISTTKKITITTQKSNQGSNEKQNSTVLKIVASSSGTVNKSHSQTSRPKSPPKRVTPKPNVNKTEVHYTSKVEKVTLKPVPLVSTEKVSVSINEPPMFVAKVKGTLNTATKKQNNSNIHLSKVQESVPKAKPSQNHHSNTTLSNDIIISNNTPNVDVKPSKINVLVPKTSANDIIKVETITATYATKSDTTQAPPSSTTKRPRHNSKRKKNKLRRRKPSTSSTTTGLTYANTNYETTTHAQNNALQEVQESKIEPETKLVSQNSTKNKQSSKNPISTQIYNFLSREVMPSFGVMSLVGLGLGLASYFLYPFGGAITRRNYAIEPNYKLHFDEYGGGNNGQNEEDVLKQVFQGMTTHDNNNYNTYYHYNNGFNDANAEVKKNNNVRYPTVNDSKQKPVENTNVKLNYRNLDYKFHDVGHPNKVHDKSTVISPSTMTTDSNRQFVVGSVLKDYVSTDIPKSDPNINMSEKSSAGHEENSYDYAKLISSNMPSDYDMLENASIKPEDEYNKYEVTSTVIAVEHGPRSIKIKRSIDAEMEKNEKASVIQVIPPKSETEPKEEDISNEILDIIDSVIPKDDKPPLLKNKKMEFHENKQKNKNVSLLKATSAVGNVEKITPTVTPSETSTATNKKEDKTDTSTMKTKDENENSTSWTTLEWEHNSNSSAKPTAEQPNDKFNIFTFVRNVAEVKFRLGLTLLKHASEGFTRYISHVQKRLNGET